MYFLLSFTCMNVENKIKVESVYIKFSHFINKILIIIWNEYNEYKRSKNYLEQCNNGKKKLNDLKMTYHE